MKQARIYPKQGQHKGMYVELAARVVNSEKQSRPCLNRKLKISFSQLARKKPSFSEVLNLVTSD